MYPDAKICNRPSYLKLKSFILVQPLSNLPLYLIYESMPPVLNQACEIHTAFHISTRLLPQTSPVSQQHQELHMLPNLHYCIPIWVNGFNLCNSFVIASPTSWDEHIALPVSCSLTGLLFTQHLAESKLFKMA